MSRNALRGVGVVFARSAALLVRCSPSAAGFRRVAALLDASPGTSAGACGVQGSMTAQLCSRAFLSSGVTNGDADDAPDDADNESVAPNLYADINLHACKVSTSKLAATSVHQGLPEVADITIVDTRKGRGGKQRTAPRTAIRSILLSYQKYWEAHPKEDPRPLVIVVKTDLATTVKAEKLQEALSQMVSEYETISVSVLVARRSSRIGHLFASPTSAAVDQAVQELISQTLREQGRSTGDAPAHSLDPSLDMDFRELSDDAPDVAAADLEEEKQVPVDAAEELQQVVDAAVETGPAPEEVEAAAALAPEEAEEQSPAPQEARLTSEIEPCVSLEDWAGAEESQPYAAEIVDDVDPDTVRQELLAAFTARSGQEGSASGSPTPAGPSSCSVLLASSRIACKSLASRAVQSKQSVHLIDTAPFLPFFSYSFASTPTQRKVLKERGISGSAQHEAESATQSTDDLTEVIDTGIERKGARRAAPKRLTRKFQRVVHHNAEPTPVVEVSATPIPESEPLQVDVAVAPSTTPTQRDDAQDDPSELMLTTKEAMADVEGNGVELNAGVIIEEHQSVEEVSVVSSSVVAAEEEKHHVEEAVVAPHMMEYDSFSDLKLQTIESSEDPVQVVENPFSTVSLEKLLAGARRGRSSASRTDRALQLNRGKRANGKTMKRKAPYKARRKSAGKPGRLSPQRRTSSIRKKAGKKAVTQRKAAIKTTTGKRTNRSRKVVLLKRRRKATNKQTETIDRRIMKNWSLFLSSDNECHYWVIFVDAFRIVKPCLCCALLLLIWLFFFLSPSGQLIRKGALCHTSRVLGMIPCCAALLSSRARAGLVTAVCATRREYGSPFFQQRFSSSTPDGGHASGVPPIDRNIADDEVIEKFMQEIELEPEVEEDLQLATESEVDAHQEPFTADADATVAGSLLEHKAPAAPLRVPELANRPRVFLYGSLFHTAHPKDAAQRRALRHKGKSLVDPARLYELSKWCYNILPAVATDDLSGIQGDTTRTILPSVSSLYIVEDAESLWKVYDKKFKKTLKQRSAEEVAMYKNFSSGRRGTEQELFPDTNNTKAAVDHLLNQLKESIAQFAECQPSVSHASLLPLSSCPLTMVITTGLAEKEAETLQRGIQGVINKGKVLPASIIRGVASEVKVWVLTNEERARWRESLVGGDVGFTWPDFTIFNATRMRASEQAKALGRKLHTPPRYTDPAVHVNEQEVLKALKFIKQRKDTARQTEKPVPPPPGLFPLEATVYRKVRTSHLSDRAGVVLPPLVNAFVVDATESWKDVAPTGGTEQTGELHAVTEVLTWTTPDGAPLIFDTSMYKVTYDDSVTEKDTTRGGSNPFIIEESDSQYGKPDPRGAVVKKLMSRLSTGKRHSTGDEAARSTVSRGDEGRLVEPAEWKNTSLANCLSQRILNRALLRCDNHAYSTVCVLSTESSQGAIFQPLSDLAAVRTAVAFEEELMFPLTIFIREASAPVPLLHPSTLVEPNAKETTLSTIYGGNLDQSLASDELSAPVFFIPYLHSLESPPTEAGSASTPQAENSIRRHIVQGTAGFLVFDSVSLTLKATHSNIDRLLAYLVFLLVNFTSFFFQDTSNCSLPGRLDYRLFALGCMSRNALRGVGVVFARSAALLVRCSPSAAGFRRVAALLDASPGTSAGACGVQGSMTAQLCSRAFLSSGVTNGDADDAPDDADNESVAPNLYADINLHACKVSTSKLAATSVHQGLPEVADITIVDTRKGRGGKQRTAPRTAIRSILLSYQKYWEAHPKEDPRPLVIVVKTDLATTVKAEKLQEALSQMVSEYETISVSVLVARRSSRIGHLFASPTSAAVDQAVQELISQTLREQGRSTGDSPAHSLDPSLDMDFRELSDDAPDVAAADLEEKQIPVDAAEELQQVVDAAAEAEPALAAAEVEEVAAADLEEEKQVPVDAAEELQQVVDAAAEAEPALAAAEVEEVAAADLEEEKQVPVDAAEELQQVVDAAAEAEPALAAAEVEEVAAADLEEEKKVPVDAAEELQQVVDAAAEAEPALAAAEVEEVAAADLEEEKQVPVDAAEELQQVVDAAAEAEPALAAAEVEEVAAADLEEEKQVPVDAAEELQQPALAAAEVEEVAAADLEEEKQVPVDAAEELQQVVDAAVETGPALAAAEVEEVAAADLEEEKQVPVDAAEELQQVVDAAAEAEPALAAAEVEEVAAADLEEEKQVPVDAAEELQQVVDAAAEAGPAPEEVEAAAALAPEEAEEQSPAPQEARLTSEIEPCVSLEDWAGAEESQPYAAEIVDEVDPDTVRQELLAAFTARSGQEGSASGSPTPAGPSSCSVLLASSRIACKSLASRAVQSKQSVHLIDTAPFLPFFSYSFASTPTQRKVLKERGISGSAQHEAESAPEHGRSDRSYRHRNRKEGGTTRCSEEADEKPTPVVEVSATPIPESEPLQVDVAVAPSTTPTQRDDAQDDPSELMLTTKEAMADVEGNGVELNAGVIIEEHQSVEEVSVVSSSVVAAEEEKHHVEEAVVAPHMMEYDSFSDLKLQTIESSEDPVQVVEHPFSTVSLEKLLAGTRRGRSSASRTDRALQLNRGKRANGKTMKRKAPYKARRKSAGKQGRLSPQRRTSSIRKKAGKKAVTQRKAAIKTTTGKRTNRSRKVVLKATNKQTETIDRRIMKNWSLFLSSDNECHYWVIFVDAFRILIRKGALCHTSRVLGMIPCCAALLSSRARAGLVTAVCATRREYGSPFFQQRFSSSTPDGGHASGVPPMDRNIADDEGLDDEVIEELLQEIELEPEVEEDLQLATESEVDAHQEPFTADADATVAGSLLEHKAPAAPLRVPELANRPRVFLYGSLFHTAHPKDAAQRRALRHKGKSLVDPARLYELSKWCYNILPAVATDDLSGIQGDTTRTILPSVSSLYIVEDAESLWKVYDKKFKKTLKQRSAEEVAMYKNFSSGRRGTEQELFPDTNNTKAAVDHLLNQLKESIAQFAECQPSVSHASLLPLSSCPLTMVITTGLAEKEAETLQRGIQGVINKGKVLPPSIIRGVASEVKVWVLTNEERARWRESLVGGDVGFTWPDFTIFNATRMRASEQAKALGRKLHTPFVFPPPRPRYTDPAVHVNEQEVLKALKFIKQRKDTARQTEKPVPPPPGLFPLEATVYRKVRTSHLSDRAGVVLPPLVNAFVVDATESWKDVAPTGGTEQTGELHAVTEVLTWTTPDGAPLIFDTSMYKVTYDDSVTEKDTTRGGSNPFIIEESDSQYGKPDPRGAVVKKLMSRLSTGKRHSTGDEAARSTVSRGDEGRLVEPAEWKNTSLWPTVFVYRTSFSPAQAHKAQRILNRALLRCDNHAYSTVCVLSTESSQGAIFQPLSDLAAVRTAVAFEEELMFPLTIFIREASAPIPLLHPSTLVEPNAKETTLNTIYGGNLDQSLASDELSAPVFFIPYLHSLESPPTEAGSASAPQAENSIRRHIVQGTVVLSVSRLPLDLYRRAVVDHAVPLFFFFIGNITALHPYRILRNCVSLEHTSLFLIFFGILKSTNGLAYFLCRADELCFFYGCWMFPFLLSLFVFMERVLHGPELKNQRGRRLIMDEKAASLDFIFTVLRKNYCVVMTTSLVLAVCWIGFLFLSCAENWNSFSSIPVRSLSTRTSLYAVPPIVDFTAECSDELLDVSLHFTGLYFFGLQWDAGCHFRQMVPPALTLGGRVKRYLRLGQLLRQRAKWFGHVIPYVSLEVLEALRSDNSGGSHVPQKGHLLVLDDWNGFTNRLSATPVSGKKLWFTSQQTVRRVICAVQAFLAQQREVHGSTSDAMKYPLIVLIPSQLDAATANQEQMVLQQAMRMQARCVDHLLDQIATVWVMNSDEAWRWREALIEGSVSASWPLRPTTPFSSGPWIPSGILNHIMRRVSLKDINAVFLRSVTALPPVGHLLILRDSPVRHGEPVVRKVTALMPVIEEAMRTFIEKLHGERTDEAPLTILILSSLDVTDAEDLQRLLHYSLLLAPIMQHFPVDPVVWVLTKEQQEKLDAAYLTQKIGVSWALNATASHSSSDGSLKRTETPALTSEASAAPSEDVKMDEQRESTDTTVPAPWAPPNSVPCVVYSLPEDVPVMGEVERLWSSTPGCPVGVNSLEGLVRPPILAKLQEQLHNAAHQPTRMHVLACRVGAEQLEQNTEVMFKTLMDAAAEFFHALTGEETLREALRVSPATQGIAAETSLEDFNDEERSAAPVSSVSEKEEQPRSLARFVKLTLLLYTDLLAEMEVDLLRALLQSLYNLLSPAVRDIILAVEVVHSIVGSPSEMCQLLEGKLPSHAAPNAAPHEFPQQKVADPAQKDAASSSLPAPMSREALTEALHASTQFLKLLEQREKNIRAEYQAQQSSAPAAAAPPLGGGMMSKAELKALLEDAVEEVTARHEQAMSHLVDTMSKMVGAWTSETFMDEINTAIKKGIEPLQEHLSESAAASARFRHGVMTEAQGRDILRKVNAILAVVTKSIHSPIGMASPPGLPTAAAPRPPTSAPVQKRSESTPLPSGTNAPKKEIPNLVFKESEIRFLTNIARKRMHSDIVSSRKMAAAWLDASKLPVPGRPQRFYVVLGSAYVMDEGRSPLALLKEIVIHLIECAYLRGPLKEQKIVRRNSVKKKVTRAHVHELQKWPNDWFNSGASKQTLDKGLPFPVVKQVVPPAVKAPASRVLREEDEHRDIKPKLRKTEPKKNAVLRTSKIFKRIISHVKGSKSSRKRSTNAGKNKSARRIKRKMQKRKRATVSRLFTHLYSIIKITPEVLRSLFTCLCHPTEEEKRFIMRDHTRASAQHQQPGHSPGCSSVAASLEMLCPLGLGQHSLLLLSPSLFRLLHLIKKKKILLAKTSDTCLGLRFRELNHFLWTEVAACSVLQTTAEGSDVHKVDNIDSVSDSIQPTVRIWLVGNPTSGHGKGEEHISLLRRVIQKKLCSYNPSLGAANPDKVVAPLWYSCDFLRASAFDGVDEENNLNALFQPQFHERYATKHPKKYFFRMDPTDSTGLFEAMPAFTPQESTAVSGASSPHTASESSAVVQGHCTPQSSTGARSGISIPSSRASRGKSDLSAFDGPAIHALIVHTEARNDGYRLFERITDMVVHDQLRSLELYQRQLYGRNSQPAENKESKSDKDGFLNTRRSTSTVSNNSVREKSLVDAPDVAYVYPYVDIMAMVGGDGTLSEGVNGVCHGVLNAYEKWITSLRRIVQQLKDSGDSQYSVASQSLHTIQFYVEGVAWNTPHKDEVLVERHKIRRLSPFILYSPSGTGADFAKLGICCANVHEFVEVVQGVAGLFFYTYTSKVHAGSNPSKLWQSMSSAEEPSSMMTSVGTRFIHHGSRSGIDVKGKTSSVASSERNVYDGSFAATSVDVGRITFPKTRSVKYFINVCSMGMSVEVIQRTNRFRRKALLAALGGTLIFASSSFVSLKDVAKLGSYHASSTPAGSGEQVINPLYLHLSRMRPILSKMTKAIKKKKLYEGFPPPLESVQSPLQPMLTVEHRICHTSADILEDLDYIATSPVGSPLKNGVSYEPLSVESTNDFSLHREEEEQQHITSRWAYFLSSTVAFGNGRWFGGGMKVTPHADPTDHLLSVTNWLTSFWTFLLGVMQLYSGSHHEWESTATWDGERFLLDSGPRKSGKKYDSEEISDVERGAETMIMEADGELLESLPAIIEIGGYITMLSPAAPNKKGGERLRIGKPIPGTARHAIREAKGAQIENNSFSVSLDPVRVDELRRSFTNSNPARRSSSSESDCTPDPRGENPESADPPGSPSFLIGVRRRIQGVGSTKRRRLIKEIGKCLIHNCEICLWRWSYEKSFQLGFSSENSGYHVAGWVTGKLGKAVYLFSHPVCLFLILYSPFAFFFLFLFLLRTVESLTTLFADEFLVEKERRRQLNRQKLQELHETQEAYEQIRRTTTITDAEAAVRARNNLTGTAEISVETKPNQGDDLARKISAFTDYGDDWATTATCFVVGVRYVVHQPHSLALEGSVVELGQLWILDHVHKLGRITFQKQRGGFSMGLTSGSCCTRLNAQQSFLVSLSFFLNLFIILVTPLHFSSIFPPKFERERDIFLYVGSDLFGIIYLRSSLSVVVVVSWRLQLLYLLQGLHSIMTDSEYDDDFTHSHSKVSSKNSSRSSSKNSSRSSPTPSSHSTTSESSKESTERRPSGGVLHQSKRTTVSEVPDDHTTYRNVSRPDTVEDMEGSGSISGDSVSDHRKECQRSSSYSTTSSATPARQAVGSAPAGRQSTGASSAQRRADSAGNRDGGSITLPPLGKQRIQSGGMKTSPQISPARSDRSRGGIHSSAATIRTSLLDRIDDLKSEIKEIDNRIGRRQRELERWKNLTTNTSQRRRRFVDKLLSENELLEKKLERYDGQVVNVAFLIARTEEQLRRVQARLKEVTKIKRALAARDKRAAHTIEVVHRYMPSAEELETREVNETIYSCASLEKKVANARDTLKSTEESLELMNKNCERLQREVDRRNLANISVKQYESLRATQESQAKEIQKLRESISIYINAVNAERSRVANAAGATPRDGGDTVPTYVRELQRKREVLQEQVDEVKAAIAKRIQKIETNKKYMHQFRKKKVEGEGADESQVLSSRASAATSPSQSATRQRESKPSSPSAKKLSSVPSDPLEQALLSADQATKRIQQEINHPDKINEKNPKEDSVEMYRLESAKIPSPGERAAQALAGAKPEPPQQQPPPSLGATRPGPSTPTADDDNEDGFVEEELEEEPEEEEGAAAGEMVCCGMGYAAITTHRRFKLFHRICLPTAAEHESRGEMRAYVEVVLKTAACVASLYLLKIRISGEQSKKIKYRLDIEVSIYCSFFSLMMALSWFSIVFSCIMIVLTTASIGAASNLISCGFVTQRTQCGHFACDPDTHVCVACSKDADCYPSGMFCESNTGKCKLRGFFRFNSFVAMFFAVVVFPMKTAVGLSQSTICGQSTLNVYLLVSRKYPDSSWDRPLINYQYLSLLLPLGLVGAHVGGILSKMCPDFLRLLLLFALLSVVLYSTVKKVKAQYAADQLQNSVAVVINDNADTAVPPSAAEENSSPARVAQEQFPQFEIFACCFSFFILLFLECLSRLCSCGGFFYWLCTILAVAVLLVVFYRTRQRLSLLAVSQPEVLTLNGAKKSSVYYPLVAVLAGAGAAMLGIGGGLVLGFVLYEVLTPEEASATSGAATFFISFSSAIPQVLAGILPLDYGIILFVVGLAITSVGQFVIMDYIRKNGYGIYNAFISISSIIQKYYVSITFISFIIVKSTPPRIHNYRRLSTAAPCSSIRSFSLIVRLQMLHVNLILLWSKIMSSWIKEMVISIAFQSFIDCYRESSGWVHREVLAFPIQRVVVLQQLGQHKEYGTVGLFRYVYQNDGLKGFWKGNLTSMIIRVPYSGLQYMLYTKMKFFAQDWIDQRHQQRSPDHQVSRWVDIVEKFIAKCGAGGLSAAIAGAAVYPGEVVRLRLMSGEKRFTGIMHTTRLIYQETSSLRNFYRGLVASLVQRVPDLLINFATYETVKYNVLESKRLDSLMASCGLGGFKRAKDIVATMIGGSAAALASIAFVFPLDVAKRRIGMSGQGKEKEVHRGVVSCLSSIYRKEGIRAWYGGAAMEAARCVPQVILMWMFIEGVQRQLEALEKSWGHLN
eukprot:gene4058-2908_t